MRPLPPTVITLVALSSLTLQGCKGDESAAPTASAPVSANPAPTNSGATEPAPTGTSDGKVSVLKTEIVPVNEGIPKENKSVPHFQVVWEWKNEGSTPIGTLKGDVRAYDKDGALTYEAKDQLLFAKYEESEAVAPGASVKVEKGQGHSMGDLKAGDPVKAEVTITSAAPVMKIP